MSTAQPSPRFYSLIAATFLLLLLSACGGGAAALEAPTVLTIEEQSVRVSQTSAGYGTNLGPNRCSGFFLDAGLRAEPLPYPRDVLVPKSASVFDSFGRELLHVSTDIVAQDPSGVLHVIVLSCMPDIFKRAEDLTAVFELQRGSASYLLASPPFQMRN